MQYRSFGQTGLNVSAIGFGCWELGGSYGHFDDSEVISAIHRALDLGINCFDTAQGYGFGNSERLLAKGLGARRKDIILVTKWGVGYNDALSDKGRDSRAARVKLAIETSLTHLNTEACMQTRRVDVGQYGYHLFDRRMERDVFPLHAKHGIGLMGYGSLAHGLLTGAFDHNTTFASSDWRSRGGAFNMPLFTAENFPRNLRAVEDLKGIAKQIGSEIYHLALAWVLSNPALSVALVGARTASEVEANMGALDVEFSEAALKAIDAVFERYGIDTRPAVWVE